MAGFTDSRGEAGDGSSRPERRRPSVRSVSFAPDPRRLRSLLAEVEATLEPNDPALVRRVRLLVGEIVARVIASDLEAEIQLDIEIMRESVRIEICPAR